MRMSFFQRVMAWFGRDYVRLSIVTGRQILCPVRWQDGIPFAAPYLPETECQLLPGGKVKGDSYIKGWTPVTPKVTRLHQEAVLGVQHDVESERRRVLTELLALRDYAALRWGAIGDDDERVLH